MSEQELKELASDAIWMCAHGDYANGVEHNGIDEGLCHAAGYLGDLFERAKLLGVLLKGGAPVSCEQELCSKAVKKWGCAAQIDMLIEECSELITALLHMRRHRKHNVIEEIADVEILLTQIKQFFLSTALAEAKQKKLDRLEQRLKDDRVRDAFGMTDEELVT
jgi:hypothetical protein